MGTKNKTYICLEAGMNHNGSLKIAKQLILEASKAGANAIKFQTYTADDLVCKGTPKFWNYKEDKGQDQYEAYKKLKQLSYKDYPELIKLCKKLKIEFLSTAFSFESADFLNKLGMKMFKVASSDLTHLPYLKHIAKFNKPIILSTGASTMEEIEDAVKTIEDYHSKIIILHCTLCYPTKPEDDNLGVIATLKERFPEYPIGISDHTLGVFSSAIACAKGATFIEKHFTLDKTMKGNADHWLSIDPSEAKELVCMCRDIETLTGSEEKKVFDCEKDTRKYDKRSIVAKVFIPKGTKITEKMITYKRPGTGIPPKDKDKVIGQKAKQDILEDTIIKL